MTLQSEPKKNINVLLIEDSEEDAALSLLSLKRGGFRVQVRRIQSEKEVKEAFLNRVWDVVISDYNIPSFNLFSALKRIREVDPDVPFLVVSGAIGEESAAELMRAGAQDVIIKGHLSRLAPAVERELAEANVRRAEKTAQMERDRALRQLQLAIQARDDFLAIASHELKTPLASLKLQTEIFKRRERSGDPKMYEPGYIRKLVYQADKQVSRLAKLVDDMLDIARIRTGKIALQPEKAELSEIVRDVLDRLAPALNEAHTPVLEQQIQRIEGEWDRFRIEQIITNLLSNAMKYGEKKSIYLRIFQENDGAHLVIRDQGIGIAKEAQTRIFDQFERAVPASGISGLGLGLYITRKIVEAHGGRVWAESAGQGKGAAFHVWLPSHAPIGASAA